MEYMFVRIFLCLAIFLGVAIAPIPKVVQAAESVESIDSDGDGLSDEVEVQVYHTNPYYGDTDNDGYSDGDEVKFSFDPNIRAPGDRIQKHIEVNLKNQELTYGVGPYTIKTVKVSTGTKGYFTPKGSYSIIKKIPVHHYKGSNYNYPNTRWNMMFKPAKSGNFYIHGAYWHNNFGKPMSHGCVNVSYTDIEPLYNWADMGTKVTID